MRRNTDRPNTGASAPRTPKAPSGRLRIVKLEERIAPQGIIRTDPAGALNSNHNETLLRDAARAGCEAQPPRAAKKPLRLVKLEPRIAPQGIILGMRINHNETLVRDDPGTRTVTAAAPKDAPRCRFRIVKLEERIAPTRQFNHNETLVRDEAKARKPDHRKRETTGRLRITKLEERIAPVIRTNHNQTLVRDRNRTHRSGR